MANLKPLLEAKKAELAKSEFASMIDKLEEKEATDAEQAKGPQMVPQAGPQMVTQATTPVATEVLKEAPK